MIHNLALALASVAAALTFAFALAVAGLAPAPAQLAAQPIQTMSPPNADPASSGPNVQVDTIYVEAPPAPQIVTVNPIVRMGGEDAEHESGGDD